MTFDQVRVALETRMVAWADAPLAFDGRPAPPAVVTAQADKAAWCRVSIQDGNRDYATTGNLTEHSGVLFVQVFSEHAPEARQIADSLAQHLDGYSSGALLCRASTINVIGPEDGWYQINVQTPWRIYA